MIGSKTGHAQSMHLEAFAKLNGPLLNAIRVRHFFQCFRVSPELQRPKASIPGIGNAHDVARMQVVRVRVGQQDVGDPCRIYVITFHDVEHGRAAINENMPVDQY